MESAHGTLSLKMLPKVKSSDEALALLIFLIGLRQIDVKIFWWRLKLQVLEPCYRYQRLDTQQFEVGMLATRSVGLQFERPGWWK